MRVSVLFFGATADAVGSRKLEMNLEETAAAKSVIEQLSGQHPALAKRGLLFAVNEEYVDPNCPLRDGDEVAIFTAVSGG